MRGKSKEEIAFARGLCRRQTDAERALWNKLRNKQIEGVRFRRQQPIGSYIVDFVSLERKLIIEIDGGQHNQRKVREKDEEREKWLKERGYQILRFWNNDALTNIEGVLEKIEETLEGKTPSP